MNGKAFRYVHHYLGGQVFGCGGGGGGGGGAGGGRKYCTYMPNTRLGLWPWMTLPDCRSIFAGEKRLDINRQVKGQVDTG